jgi:hypothetical protein
MNDTPILTRTRTRRAGLFAKKDVASPQIEESNVEEAESDVAPIRPQLRNDDPRQRASLRAAELRDHLGNTEASSSQFDILAENIPDGWTYNWKRISVFEWEDKNNLINVRRDGWDPVPSSRHPEMMPKGDTSGYIIRDGMMLMECPTEIVDERKRFELKKARDQVRFKEAQLSGTPEGTLTRDHAQVKPQIKKSFEAMPIPKE